MFCLPVLSFLLLFFACKQCLKQDGFLKKYFLLTIVKLIVLDKENRLPIFHSHHKQIHVYSHNTHYNIYPCRRNTHLFTHLIYIIIYTIHSYNITYYLLDLYTNIITTLLRTLIILMTHIYFSQVVRTTLNCLKNFL